MPTPITPRSRPAALDLPGGEIDGRYLIENELARGSWGRVLRGRHRELDLPVAIKIAGIKGAPPTAREAFYRAARAAAALDHPNVVQVLDFGDDSSRGLYLVMQLLDGESAAVRLRREKALPPIAACDVASQIADGLDHLHGRGLVHGEVCPHNAFLTSPRLPQPIAIRRPSEARRSHVRLLGIVPRPRVQVSPTGRRPRHSFDGPAFYAAPERLVAGQPTPSTDLYALGATLFELIAGRPPFVGSTDEIIDHHLLDAAPTVSAVSGLPVPPEVERIVAALLAKKPQDRPADARAAARVLRNCIAGLGGRRVRHTPRPFVMRAQYSEAIVDGLPLGLFVANAAGVVLFANPMLPRLLGENLGETRLGDSLLATIFPGIEHEARAVILRGRAIRRTGTTSHGRTLQLILSPHRRDGEVVGVCGVIDVTATQPK